MKIMGSNKKLNKGDKVYIESIYGEPYHGVIKEIEDSDFIVVKRDDQDYPRPYNSKRLTKDEE